VIPSTLIGLLAEILDRCYTRSDIVSTLMSSGAGGEEPRRANAGTYNKSQMVIEWLNRLNRDNPEAALTVLGNILRTLLEPDSRRHSQPRPEDIADLNRKLDDAGLTYAAAGRVVDSLNAGLASRSLSDLLEEHDFPGVLEEFDRAISNLGSDPREAASAASNILEAICKEYIEQRQLQMPSDQSLYPLFKVVRDDLGLNPESVSAQDKIKILSGLASIVSGVGALRTHASSAHAPETSGGGPELSQRDARLAVHASHAAVVFIIDTWAQRDI
jgi:hypothetical protein